ncbi:hypothetical protein VSP76_14865, partial [Klebsiella pneumoniae]|nr:hypothetical protein [Klebsiella pneumoniae]
MNKSVARGIALALLSATSFYAAADCPLRKEQMPICIIS